MSNVEQWEHNEQRAMETEITTLREQVEKLTKERGTEIARNRPLQSLIKLTEKTKSFLLKKSEENKEAVKQLDSERQANALLTEELAALAEQNAKMRKALTKWRYLDGSYNWRCGHCGNEVEDGHKEGCALSLPDLASPVLNRIRAEGMRMAAEILIDPMDRAAAQKICAQADELEKQNG